jgi:hypothetical protein
MGRIEEALGQADAAAELAHKLDELVVRVGDRGAPDGRAVEEVKPDRFRAGCVDVDHIAPFEVGLQPTKAEKEVEDGSVKGGLLFGGWRGDAAAYQVMGMPFEHLVDELGAQGLFVWSGEPPLPAALALGLAVGERLGRL